jgi:hypothetical protein
MAVSKPIKILYQIVNTVINNNLNS